MRTTVTGGEGGGEVGYFERAGTGGEGGGERGGECDDNDAGTGGRVGDDVAVVADSGGVEVEASSSPSLLL
jgi:hypothetical protein